MKAGGNIQFLLESTGKRTDVPAFGFYSLFGRDEYGESIYSCKSLTSAPALPAKTLANSCYYNMFQGCASLTAAPEIPATTLANSCCFNMFTDCTSLTSAPATLPATTLAESCYSYMFAYCPFLTTAPALPATTLADYCYFCMFYGCSKLTSIDVSFTAWDTTNATMNWVNGAGTQATGEKTFTCPSTLPDTRGNNNIPTGWTIIEK